jgi:hypothetical protein
MKTVNLSWYRSFLFVVLLGCGSALFLHEANLLLSISNLGDLAGLLVTATAGRAPRFTAGASTDEAGEADNRSAQDSSKPIDKFG